MNHRTQSLRAHEGPSYRGCGPQDYTRSDTRILEDISEELTEHDQIDARDISVRVVAGEVTLTGSVPDEAMTKLAVLAAQQQRGVKAVHSFVPSAQRDGMDVRALSKSAQGSMSSAFRR
jgi:osmotically-inducible protein OsmY